MFKCSLPLSRFYPFYDSGATLSALKTSLTALTGVIKKPIIVAETDWPVTCSGVSLTEKSVPVSAAGQEQYVNVEKAQVAGDNGQYGGEVGLLAIRRGATIDRRKGVRRTLAG